MRYRQDCGIEVGENTVLQELLLASSGHQFKIEESPGRG
jgi:hypothetical protein